MSPLPASTTSTTIPLQPIQQALAPKLWHTVELLERGPYPNLKRTVNVETGDLAQAIDSTANLRIVVCPSDDEDEWRPRSLGQLFEFFQIPDEFASERVQSVSHSFGSSSSNNVFRSWFHFLCRYIPNHQMGLVGAARYWKAGFFISKSASLGVTLVCFGTPPTAIKRLELFANSPSWSTACKSPYVLFNVILGALFLEVDETVWTIGDIFGKLEREITNQIDGASNIKQYYKPPFGTLHRHANDLAYLKETVESNLLVTDAILERTKKRNLEDPTQANLPPTEDDLVREDLLYHQSLFRSTQLRLSSLDKRMQNASNLAFNMVTQQDSLIMMQDSASVTILTAVAAAFLPITSIATIVGSQLFVTSQDEQGNWIIVSTPLIRYLYTVGVPITVAVFITAYIWSIRRRSAWVATASSRSRKGFQFRR